MKQLSQYVKGSNEYKYYQCRNVIEALIAACGPVTMREIVTECREQALEPSYMVKALNDLRNTLAIKYDAEYQCFE